MKKLVITLLLLSSVGALLAQDIALPSARKSGGKSFMETLNQRQTNRKISNKTLPKQLLADLLWAATGVNREDGRMTAPTASNTQHVEVFVALPEATYIYMPKTHTLQLYKKGDHRRAFSTQDIVTIAPVVLAYVSNYDKMKNYKIEQKEKYSKTDVGNVSQNVYLFCASEDLATVVLGRFDADVLRKALGLEDYRHPILTQPVGYPEK